MIGMIPKDDFLTQEQTVMRTCLQRGSLCYPSLYRTPMNIILLPGSGCTPTMECNYYSWLAKTLVDRGICADVRVTVPGMPDPHVCRRSKWIPHCEEVLKCDANSVVVGHSSGAVCALRLAERNVLRGIVLVAGYDDDLGDENERASGYFGPDPFDYEKIKANCAGGVDCVIGLRDSLVPAEMQRALAAKLDARETLCERRDHFFTPPAEEIVDAILRFA